MPRALIVHGGAWTIPADRLEATERGCREAAAAGYAVLKSGGKATDAVEAAIRYMENDPNFNAGKGSVLTAEGKVEMDAVLQSGSDLAAGGVASVSALRNPISAAKRVMEQGEHVLMMGRGAETYCAELGAEVCDPGELVTPDAVRELQEFGRAGYNSSVASLGFAKVATKKSSTLTTLPSLLVGSSRRAAVARRERGRRSASPSPMKSPRAGESSNNNNYRSRSPPPMKKKTRENDRNNSFETYGHDTVGCCALDNFGDMAAGTSTGGITGKRPGRVGDSPLLGAGCSADNDRGCCSTTGHGEAILRVQLANRVVQAVQDSRKKSKEESKSSAAAACEKVTQACSAELTFMSDRVGGAGGCIALSPDGQLGAAFTTRHMAWARCHEADGDGDVVCGLNECDRVAVVLPPKTVVSSSCATTARGEGSSSAPRVRAR